MAETADKTGLRGVWFTAKYPFTVHPFLKPLERKSDKEGMADLQGLSKDDLIAIIIELRAENVSLKRRLAKLEKDSANSHKPPSSDIVKPGSKPTKGRGRKRKIGGYPGSAGASQA